MHDERIEARIALEFGQVQAQADDTRARLAILAKAHNGEAGSGAGGLVA